MRARRATASALALVLAGSGSAGAAAQHAPAPAEVARANADAGANANASASANAEAGARDALLLVPRAADATLVEIAARLRGELRAAGFRVTERAISDADTPRSAFEAGHGADSARAVILLRNAPTDNAGVELWISDRVFGVTSNTHLSAHTPGPGSARRVAIEAADILRARLAERRLGDEGEDAPAPRAPQADDSAASPPAPRHSHVALGAGALALWRRELWGLSVAPQLTIVWAFAPARDGAAPGAWRLHPGLQLRVAGYGNTIRRSIDEGSAEAQQGVGLASAFVRAVSDYIVEPELALGAGVYGVAVTGHTEPPYQPHRQTELSPLISGTVAAETRLGHGLSLRLATDVVYVLTKSAVRIADRQVARSGGTMFGVNLELRARLW